MRAAIISVTMIIISQHLITQLQSYRWTNTNTSQLGQHCSHVYAFNIPRIITQPEFAC